jgi:RNA polymerase sigma-70 factor (ECF subfamily)
MFLLRIDIMLEWSLNMEDETIISLYWARSESAVAETAKKYGGYLFKIAANILKNKQDSEECVNDTYMKAWNAMPPERPVKLPPFLGRITRNLSINKYEKRNAKKRGGDETALIFDELEECIPSRDNIEKDYEGGLTGEMISRFLRTVSEESRIVFVRRYWYADSVALISGRLKISQSKVKTTLFRTRAKLREYLEREGVSV